MPSADESYIVSRKVVDIGDGLVQITETVNTSHPDCPFVLTKYEDGGFQVDRSGEPVNPVAEGRTIIFHKRPL